MIIALPGHVYHRLVERFTTPTDRLMYRDGSRTLPDGRVEFELDADIAAELDRRKLAGETYADYLARIVENGGLLQ